jgi:hypothetical protein
VPDAGAYTDSWYVLKWNDVDRDGQPGAPDSFTVVGSGR